MKIHVTSTRKYKIGTFKNTFHITLKNESKSAALTKTTPHAVARAQLSARRHQPSSENFVQIRNVYI